MKPAQLTRRNLGVEALTNPFQIPTREVKARPHQQHIRKGRDTLREISQALTNPQQVQETQRARTMNEMPSYDSPEKMQAALDLMKGAPLDDEMKEKLKTLKEKLDVYKYKTMTDEQKQRLGLNATRRLEKLSDVYYPETEGDRAKQATEAATQQGEADATARIAQYRDTALHDADVAADASLEAEVDTKYAREAASVYHEILFDKSEAKPKKYASIRRSRKELNELVGSDAMKKIHNLAVGGDEELQEWISYVSWLAHIPQPQRTHGAMTEEWLGGAMHILNERTEEVLNTAAAKSMPPSILKSVADINKWLKADLSKTGWERLSRGHGGKLPPSEPPPPKPKKGAKKSPGGTSGSKKPLMTMEAPF